MIMDSLQAKAAFFKDPVAFARYNILLVANSNQQVLDQGGLTKVALEPDAKGFYHGEGYGGSLPVIQVVDGTNKGEAAFDAYWCGYNHNSVRSITVWKDANAMFTARMDGCTLGLGVQSGDGAVLVTHVNERQFMADDDSTAEMERQQCLEARKEVGKNGTLLEPEKYRRWNGTGAKTASTTFGVRDPVKGQWTFYAQILEVDADRLRIHGIKKLRCNGGKY
jgi:hypothetical protein